MVAQRFQVDLNKPLVFQVGYLGKDYDEWVHEPIVCKEGPRFFESDIMEIFTRTRWWVVPIVWVPLACWFISMSAGTGFSCPQLASLVLTGLFLWTLLEYTLHRFLFHVKTQSYWTNTMHYLLHGCHHKHPMDGWLAACFPSSCNCFPCRPGMEPLQAVVDSIYRSCTICRRTIGLCRLRPYPLLPSPWPAVDLDAQKT